MDADNLVSPPTPFVNRGPCFFSTNFNGMTRSPSLGNGAKRHPHDVKPFFSMRSSSLYCRLITLYVAIIFDGFEKLTPVLVVFRPTRKSISSLPCVRTPRLVIHHPLQTETKRSKCTPLVSEKDTMRGLYGSIVCLLFLTFPRIGHSFLPQPLLPMWYPIMSVREASQKPLHKIMLNNVPLVMYPCPHNDSTSLFPFIVHSDICPHQGASLSKGWINSQGHLQCPYHGFEFCHGTFCRIPNPLYSIPYVMSTTKMPLYPTVICNDMLYVAGDHSRFPDVLPYQPPEQSNPHFRCISGSRVMAQSSQRVVENLLDMLHISYVHSFGSRSLPLPMRIRYEPLSPIAGRSTFFYHPNPTTISRIWGNTSTVRVENEFHLPTTTITRVFAGSLIKTVFTQSLPLKDGSTLLVWKIYRNFWKDPFIDLFSSLGDVLLRVLMEKTIDEDRDILQHVYTDAPSTLSTRYDVTITEFRKTLRSLIDRTSVADKSASL